MAINFILSHFLRPELDCSVSGWKVFSVASVGLGRICFYIFCCSFNFLCNFLAKFAPETKGKTFSQIEAEFAIMNNMQKSSE